MNCIARGCTASIEETWETPMLAVEGKQVVNTTEQARRQEAVAAWGHVAVVAGQTTVLSGHTCPKHALTPENVSLTVGGK